MHSHPPCRHLPKWRFSRTQPPCSAAPRWIPSRRLSSLPTRFAQPWHLSAPLALTELTFFNLPTLDAAGASLLGGVDVVVSVESSAELTASAAAEGASFLADFCFVKAARGGVAAAPSAPSSCVPSFCFAVVDFDTFVAARGSAGLDAALAMISFESFTAATAARG
jgi:hypothetical protein